MTRHARWWHWHVGCHHDTGAPDTPILCFDNPDDAVRALGDAISAWAETQLQRPDDERDDEAEFAHGLAEIFIGGRSPEFGDEVTRVRRSGTGYHFGNQTYWAVPVPWQRPDNDSDTPPTGECGADS